MNIKIAEEKDFDDVKKITRETIMEIYPMYFPQRVSILNEVITRLTILK